MAFFSLIGTAFSSIFYGIIVTAVIMALLYVVLRSLNKGITETIPFYITGVVLAILLVIQSSLMIGAIQAKDAADSAEIYLTQLLENSYGTVSAQDSQNILDAVTEEFPILGTYFGVANFAGHDAQEIASSMHEVMTEYLSSYIWHRVWWSLGIIVVSVVIALCFRKTYDYAGDINENIGIY